MTLYAHGMTKRVKKVDTITPPMITTDKGIRVSEPGPKPKAGGIAAAMVAKLVMRIGRKRCGHALIKASRTDIPVLRF